MAVKVLPADMPGPVDLRALVALGGLIRERVPAEDLALLQLRPQHRTYKINPVQAELQAWLPK
jgi:hypothetical protein